MPPVPKRNPRNPREPRLRGEFLHATAYGWQHGDPPKCPPGLLKASRDAWAIWLESWVASFWGPLDLPTLRRTILLYDEVERGEGQPSELRRWMDLLGLTPKGQQERRWRAPVAEDVPEVSATPGGSVRDRLKAV